MLCSKEKCNSQHFRSASDENVYVFMCVCVCVCSVPDEQGQHNIRKSPTLSNYNIVIYTCTGFQYIMIAIMSSLCMLAVGTRAFLDYLFALPPFSNLLVLFWQCKRDPAFLCMYLPYSHIFLRCTGVSFGVW